MTFRRWFTGKAGLIEPSARSLADGNRLFLGAVALHLASFLLLLVWFPFGKLMHAVFFAFARGATGIRFGRRGVAS